MSEDPDRSNMRDHYHMSPSVARASSTPIGSAGKIVNIKSITSGSFSSKVMSPNIAERSQLFDRIEEDPGHDESCTSRHGGLSQGRDGDGIYWSTLNDERTDRCNKRNNIRLQQISPHHQNRMSKRIARYEESEAYRRNVAESPIISMSEAGRLQAQQAKPRSTDLPNGATGSSVPSLDDFFDYFGFHEPNDDSLFSEVPRKEPVPNDADSTEQCGCTGGDGAVRIASPTAMEQMLKQSESSGMSLKSHNSSNPFHMVDLGSHNNSPNGVGGTKVSDVECTKHVDNKNSRSSTGVGVGVVVKNEQVRKDDVVVEHKMGLARQDGESRGEHARPANHVTCANTDTLNSGPPSRKQADTYEYGSGASNDPRYPPGKGWNA